MFKIFVPDVPPSSFGMINTGTLFPVSKKKLKRDCYKDKCLEANEEPQVQCGFPPCQGVFVEMQSPCQQTSHCQFLGGHHERKTWFARLSSKILKW